VLLRDSTQLHAILNDIEQVATEASAEEAVTQAEKVQEHLDRVAAWGGDRQRAWSDYYQFVQRYLRGVVRLDPDRAVSQRLRDQLARWLERPFALNAAGEPSIRLLRDDPPKVDRPPLTRAHADRERSPDIVPPDPAPVALEQRVDDALARGCDRLADVAAHVLPALPLLEQYRSTGRVADLVAERADISSPLERRWIPLDELGLVIEDWALISRREP